MDEKLKNIVRSCALDVEAAADGELYELDNGNTEIIEDMEAWKQAAWERKKEEFVLKYPKGPDGDPVLPFAEEGYDSADEMIEDEIGTVDDIDEPEQISIVDYITKCSLGDIRFEVNNDMECLGGKVLLAFGGPNVWLTNCDIRGYWGCDTETWDFNSNTCAALEDFFIEEWAAIHGR